MNNPNVQRIELLKALAVCAELTGTEMSEGAASVMVDDLTGYPHTQVMAALIRCRRELRGKLTIAAVLERLDDGRPGANEAWAMIPQNEEVSVVWTEEMAQAFGVAHPLLDAKQTIAARSAFIEAYERAVTVARAEQRRVNWMPSLGHDVQGRAKVLENAVRLGRLTAEHAANLLPAPPMPSLPLLENKGALMPAKVREQLQAFSLKVVK